MLQGYVKFLKKYQQSASKGEYKISKASIIILEFYREDIIF